MDLRKRDARFGGYNQTTAAEIAARAGVTADTDDTGRVFRFEAGHRSDAKSDGTPI